MPRRGLEGAGICSLDVSLFPLRSQCSRELSLTLKAAKRDNRHGRVQKMTVLSRGKGL